MNPQELACARALLGFYSPHAPGSHQPGGFQTAFIRLLEASDSSNQAKALNTWPDWIPAVRVMMDEGSAALEKRIATNRTLTVYSPDGELVTIMDATGKTTDEVDTMEQEIRASMYEGSVVLAIVDVTGKTTEEIADVEYGMRSSLTVHSEFGAKEDAGWSFVDSGAQA
jgi:hypothetical protein